MTLPIEGALSGAEFAGWPAEAVEAALDDAWATRSLATDRACRLYAARILSTVREHVPDADTVVLREDTSHLPAHGHVDAILGVGGEDLLVRLGSWHDLDWTGSVDEDVWDLHHMAPHLFTLNEDGVRRLILTDASPAEAGVTPEAE